MVETKSGFDAGKLVPARDDFCRLDFLPIASTDLAFEMGADQAPNDQARDIRNALVVELLMTAWRDPSRWVAYARDRNCYSVQRRYSGRLSSFKFMMWAVDSLVAARLVENQKTRPGPKRRYKSRLRATPRMLERATITQIHDLRRFVFETIRLKDQSKKLRKYVDNSTTNSWRSDAIEQNEALRGLHLSLADGSWVPDPHGFVRRGDRVLNLASDQTYRVFNLDWRHGGRWYGGWWQSIGSRERSLILIDGEPTIEIDYPHLHPTLLAAVFGVAQGSKDAYDVDGVPRDYAKMAFNVMLNADSEEAAVSSLQQALHACHPRAEERPRQRAVRYVEAVKARHPKFAPAWGTGMGRRLQFVDGQMCAQVQRRMRMCGSGVLSVHDSFVAPEGKKPLLEAVMADVLEHAKRQLYLDNEGWM